MHFDPDDPELQPFRVLDYQMQATLYNTIRLGILRIANPLIVVPAEIRNVKCYLDDDKWVCVDLISDEYPLVIWKDFVLSNRAIHEPVNCKVHVYHAMAGRVMGTALYAVESYVIEKLRMPVAGGK